MIRRIEITPKALYWSENGELLCIATEDSYFILKYNEAAVARSRETKEGLSEDGYDDAFDVSQVTKISRNYLELQNQRRKFVNWVQIKIHGNLCVFVFRLLEKMKKL